MRIEQIPLAELDEPELLLQSRFWARFKERFGWRPLPFVIRNNDDQSIPLLVLCRKLPAHTWIAYVPHGPSNRLVELILRAMDTGGEYASAGGDQQAYTSDAVSAVLLALTEKLRPFLPGGSVFLRYDLVQEIAEAGLRSEASIPALKRAPMQIQPPDTVIIDLDEDEQQILSAMKSKTRYNIRLSGRKGVIVRRCGVEKIDLFYRMYQETAERDRIAIHSRDYYRSLFDTAEHEPGVSVALLVAEVEEEPVAANIVTLFGTTGLYHFGASTNKHRNLMPTYALQWDAIKLCKENGCNRYDLGGIPPDADRDHPMHGLYRMKTGFGGRIVHRYGSWDFPLSGFGYALYRGAESARRFYYKKVRRFV